MGFFFQLYLPKKQLCLNLLSKYLPTELQNLGSGRGNRDIFLNGGVVKIRNDTFCYDWRRTVWGWKKCWGSANHPIIAFYLENLRMQRVSARWVLRLLKEEEKQRRVLCSREFLRCVGSGWGNFLDRIITTDETWLLHFDPEGKRELSVWKYREHHHQKKQKSQNLSVKVY